MITIYKFLWGQNYVNKEESILVGKETRTRRHNWKLEKKSASMNIVKHFFCNRLSDTWNKQIKEKLNERTTGKFLSLHDKNLRMREGVKLSPYIQIGNIIKESFLQNSKHTQEFIPFNKYTHHKSDYATLQISKNSIDKREKKIYQTDPGVSGVKKACGCSWRRSRWLHITAARLIPWMFANWARWKKKILLLFP